MGFDLHPTMVDQAKLILKKCHGLPLAISTIGGFLADKPKTIVEWRKLNDHIIAELEINPELWMTKPILMSFGGLPYHLKSSFLYLSIFPEDHKIRRKHLVRRWTAESYSKEMLSMNAEDVGEKYFDELINRSMILPGKEVDYYTGKFAYCQLHDVIREICISKAMEENFLFILEEGCNLSCGRGAIRHLSIGNS
uniref:Disease resistance protein winged helix domain-containing protein n=1 Tax=Arundo donax TaxID=35708 RepID=A0A0A9C5J4_ARUDO